MRPAPGLLLPPACHSEVGQDEVAVSVLVAAELDGEDQKVRDWPVGGPASRTTMRV